MSKIAIDLATDLSNKSQRLISNVSEALLDYLVLQSTNQSDKAAALLKNLISALPAIKTEIIDSSSRLIDSLQITDKDIGLETQKRAK